MRRSFWIDDRTTSESNGDDGIRRRRSRREDFPPTESKISVCARVKPDDEPDNGKSRVTLPLHQRLALIRMSQNLESNKEALGVLKVQGNWFGKKWTEENDNGGNDDAEIAKDEAPRGKWSHSGTANSHSNSSSNAVPSLSSGIHSVDDRQNRVVVIDPTKGLREFRFDNVLPSLCSQQYMYDVSTMGLVSDFINGSNAVILAYGQTGSGKTYTMHGPNNTTLTNIIHPCTNDNWGIIPRVCNEVFSTIAYRRTNLNLTFTTSISLSYIEIFGDTVSDLLNNGSPCGQSKVAAQRYVLDGAAEKPAETFQDAAALLMKGEKQRRTASTAMNERSSRSHTIVIVTLRQRCLESGKSVTSKLFLADLGGSEKQKKSQPLSLKSRNDSRGIDIASMDNGSSERMMEAVKINLGLLALKRCAMALNSKKKTKRHQHVPYADSKLTMLLSEGLGGNCKATVIICTSQNPRHYAETIDTFAFGQACSQISKVVFSRQNKHDLIYDLISDIDEKIKTCQEKIRKYERWEVREERRVDEFGDVEVRKTTVLVGADEYRHELVGLLFRKAELTGTRLDYTDLHGVSKRSPGMTTFGFGNAHEFGMGAQFKVRRDV